MRANATLRAFSGFTVFFLAFLLRTVHFPGVNDKVALGGLLVAATLGGFLGTALGSALRSQRPYVITFSMLGVTTVVTTICAAFFGLWAALAVALGCLLTLFTQYSSTLGIVQVLLLGALFCVISIGSTFGRILRAKPVRRLGEISYSVYLLHGLILTGVFSVDGVRAYALASIASYWLIIAICGLLLLLVATLSFILIERPGIRLGKAVAGRFAAARPVAAA